MTKKRKKEIQDFLLANPGYLKKSALYLKNNLFKAYTLQDVYDVLLEVRAFKKSASTPKLEIVKGKEHIEQFSKIKEKALKHRPQNIYTPGKYIVMGCVHAPFHYEQAFKAVFSMLKDNRNSIVGLVLAGDFLDMNSLSSHDKGKKPLQGITLDYEYQEGNTLLDNLLSPLATNISKIYIFGNHEDRYNCYMADSDNSKLGKALPDPITALRLYERGFKVYTNWKEDHITLGHYLDVSHGEFCNVHTAKKHIDTYRRSTLYYHTHRVQQYIEGAVGGYNGGSMADFRSQAFGYATRAMKNSWLNGFNTVDIDKDGFYHLQQIVMYNNRFVYGDKTYSF